MMNETIAYFWLLLTTAFVASVVGSLFTRRRRKPLPLRRIRGYQLMPLAIDAAIESNQRAHISIGSVGVGQASTLTALAALTLVYELAERQAFTQNLPIVTLSDPLGLAVTQDTLRRAYLTRNNLKTYQSYAALWLPNGERSIAFGAGIAVLDSFAPVSSHLLVGSFGAEIAFVGEASMRRDTMYVGHSTQLEGQAIAFVQSEAALIGEELFVGDAYLNPNNPSAMGRVLAMDTLRWVIIAAIILTALVNR